MYLLAPFIFAVLFMILVAFSSLIFKLIFKIKSFTGFCSGVCCSFLTNIVASIYTSIILFLIMNNLKPEAAANNNYSTNTADINKYFNYTKFGLFLLWLFFVILMAIAFLFIFFFTKRVSKPEDDYNSVFMFISGYILLPFIFFYLIWMIITGEFNTAIEEGIKKYGTEEKSAAELLAGIGSFFLP